MVLCTHKNTTIAFVYSLYFIHKVVLSSLAYTCSSYLIVCYVVCCVRRIISMFLWHSLLWRITVLQVGEALYRTSRTCVLTLHPQGSGLNFAIPLIFLMPPSAGGKGLFRGWCPGTSLLTLPMWFAYIYVCSLNIVSILCVLIIILYL